MTPAELKAALLDSFWGTERGLTASSETRAEINELITQLEALNPCENPTEVHCNQFVRGNKFASHTLLSTTAVCGICLACPLCVACPLRVASP